MNIKKKATLKAYVNSFGNITQTCQIAGIDRQTFYNWKDSDPKFKKALEDAQPKERFKDFLESKAVSRINKGSDKILLHALKTKAKDRGWSEKQEIELSGNQDKPILWKLIE
jgi:hypothetical protein